MARIKLTAGRISEFASLKGQSFLWDSEVKGLAVRAVAGSTRKSFIWQAKLGGKAIRITLGDVATWGIDEARKTARDMHVMVDKGIDPRVVKAETIAEQERARQEDERHRCTVLEAFKAYVADRKTGKSWGARHIERHEKYMDPGGKKYGRGKHHGWGETTKPGALWPLMSFALAELTSDVVATWLEKTSEKTPAEAANAFRALRAFLNWCAGEPKFNGIDASVCAMKKIRELVPAPKIKTDCLQREQLKPWFAAVQRIGNPVQSAYLQALLLTGARRNELTGVRWTDVDFQWGSMTIRDKVEGERTIPLTPYVASLLQGLPRRSEWVFSSNGMKALKPDESPQIAGHIAGPTKVHTSALRKAGLPHVTLHGLRRSFGTLAEWCEVPVGIVAQIMGHKPSALAEKHYRVRPLDLLRMWHEKIEAWILTEAGIEFDAAAAKQGLHLVPSQAA